MAQDSFGVGPCPVFGHDTTPIGDIVKNPDSKPRRVDMGQELTVGQGAYRLATDEDLDHNMVGQMRRVGVAAIIDTSGRAIPGTIAITSSTSGRLSQAICQAMSTMKFRPGKKAGVPVFAMYSEKMQFFGSSASSTDQGPQSQSSRR